MGDNNNWETNQLTFSTDGVTINVVNGTWDGMLYAPTGFENPVLGTENLPPASEISGDSVTDRVILFTAKAGASGSSLQASG